MSSARRLAAIATMVATWAALPATVAAHAELVAADPADGATLEAPPREVVLTFDAELDPDASELTVTDADGDVVGEGGVDLQVADRNVLRADMEAAAGGDYTASWVVVGTDGHPIEGTLSFSVVTAMAAEGGTPDTALAAAARSPALAALGAALLAAAMMTVVLNERPRRT